jgi:hypothetical protein
MFVWTIEKGSCVDADTIVIVNNEVMSQAGVDQNICSDNTYLNATDPLVIYPYQGVGHWTNLSGPQNLIVNSLDPQSQVINLPQGTSTFQWTVVQGSCVASDIVQITNNSVEAVASNLSECDGDIQLNGNDPSTFGGNGVWSIIAGGGTIADSTLYNSYINGVPVGTTTTLQWLVTNGSCSDSIKITVTNNNFHLSAGPDVSTCLDTVVMNADSPLPGVGEWSLISGSGTIVNSTLNTTVIRDLGQGTNVFSWTVTKNGCTNSATVSIENNSPSEARITGPVKSVESVVKVPPPLIRVQYWVSP